MTTHSTSTEAHAASEALTGPQRRRAIFAFAKARGQRGFTDEEAMRTLRIPHKSFGGSRGQLVKLGAVKKTHLRRFTRAGNKAIVWVVDNPLTDVTEAPQKTERDRLITRVRRLAASASEDELYAVAAWLEVGEAVGDEVKIPLNQIIVGGWWR